MTSLKNIAARLILAASDLYAREPVRVNTAVVSVATVAAAAVGIALSAPAALALAGVLVPIVLSELNRAVVASPATQVKLLQAIPTATAQAILDAPEDTQRQVDEIEAEAAREIAQAQANGSE